MLVSAVQAERSTEASLVHSANARSPMLVSAAHPDRSTEVSEVQY